MPVSWQLGTPPAQLIVPVRQLFVGVHAAPGLQVSLHALVSSQKPPGQDVPTGSNASSGQAFASPSHTSWMSQGPAEGLQTVPAACLPSAGQSLLDPSQVSATSQAPAASRHVAPALPAPTALHTGTPLVQSKIPSSHTFPVSQGASQLGGSPASSPASIPPSVPLSGVPASVDASAPASLNMTLTHPLPGTHASVSPQLPTIGENRHSPLVQSTSPQASTSAGQSLADSQTLSAHASGVSGEHEGVTQTPLSHWFAAGAPELGHSTFRQLRVSTMVAVVWPVTSTATLRRITRAPSGPKRVAVSSSSSGNSSSKLAIAIPRTKSSPARGV